MTKRDSELGFRGSPAAHADNETVSPVVAQIHLDCFGRYIPLVKYCHPKKQMQFLLELLGFIVIILGCLASLYLNRILQAVCRAQFSRIQIGWKQDPMLGQTFSYICHQPQSNLPKKTLRVLLNLICKMLVAEAMMIV
jgi:hypothetical protein